MQLTIQSLGQMLSSASAAAQAACTQFLDLSVGSPARAILRATSALWSVQQANVFRLLKATRLSTSFGVDVDSFVGDYDLLRDPAIFANGVETLSRFSPLSSTTVVVGATVRTGDGSQTYAIIADPANPCWSGAAGTAGGYVIPVGMASLDVPIQALVAGSAGNVIAGAISLTGSDMPGIDYVGNAAAIVDGLDAESDAALKVRFVGYVASLSKATVGACLSAVAAVQQGLSCTLRENVDEQGRFQPGHFVVVVDDGSGYPPPALLSAVYAAVDLVRPVTSTFSVQPPSVMRVSVQLTIAVGAGGTKELLLAPVNTSVTAYVSGLPAGGTLSITRIAAAAYAVDPSIANVTSVRISILSGGTPGTYATDVTAPVSTVIKAAAVTAS